jgi:hypothetical protein
MDRSGHSAEVDDIAREFHLTYEAMAGYFGYETRRESQTTWSEVPEANKRLMWATVEQLISRGAIASGPKFEALRSDLANTSILLGNTNVLLRELAVWATEASEMVHRECMEDPWQQGDTVHTDPFGECGSWFCREAVALNARVEELLAAGNGNGQP